MLGTGWRWWRIRWRRWSRRLCISSCLLLSACLGLNHPSICCLHSQSAFLRLLSDCLLHAVSAPLVVPSRRSSQPELSTSITSVRVTMHLEILPCQSHSPCRHAWLPVFDDSRPRVQGIAHRGAADIASTLWTRIPRCPHKPPQRFGAPPLTLGLAPEVPALHDTMDRADPGLA